MLAALLAATAAALLLYVFTAGAHSFALRARSAAAQASALAASEAALKQCAGEGGLVKCSSAVVFVNELGFSPAQQASFEAANGAKFYLSEPPASRDNASRICVTRIVIAGGAQRAAHFCGSEGEGK